MRVALAGPVAVEPLLPWLDTAPPPTVALWAGGSPVTELALTLLERGHEVVVAALDPAITRPFSLSGRHLRVHLGPYRARGRARDAFAAERRAVRDALRSEAVDLAHAHWQYEYALGALASGHPTLVTVRDWAPTIWRLQRPKHYLTVRLAMATTTLAWARDFTVASPYMQRRVQRWSRRPVPVIPNLVRDERFRPRQRPPRLEAPTLLAVNQGFSDRKNVKTLLRAYATVRTTRPAARLVLLGTRYGEGERAHEWARAEGLDDGVLFRGEVGHDEVSRWMGEADLLVHPSLEESFGMVLVEAMAQGLPVVAGRASGAVPWVLGEGSGGVLVDVSDAAALAAAVGDVLDDPGAWQRWSAAGFAHASARFRASVVAAQYEDAYARVLAVHGRTAGAALGPEGRR